MCANIEIERPILLFVFFAPNLYVYRDSNEINNYAASVIW